MANAEKSENKSKMLVNVYEPLIAIMKHKFDAACLKRDAYLDKALRIEAGFLRDEVKEPNSDRARNFIAENLKELKLKPLSLSLSTETAELITEVCKEKNIPRDSFINRFFLLLIASDAILKALFFFHIGEIEDIEYTYNRADHFREFERSNDVNMIDLIEFYSNKSPFYNIRDLVYDNYVIQKDKKTEITVYGHKFEKNCFSILSNDFSFIKTNNILGLNTYMTDDDVSKEEAFGRTATLAKNELDKLLAFTKSEKTKKVTPKHATPTAGEDQ